MSAISDIVAQIRTAVYGRDVREAIASGIEQCYADYVGGFTPDMSITAAKIDTRDISAIQALLGIASIADARIGQATIDLAQINNLNARIANIADAQIGNATIGTAQIDNLDVKIATIANAQIGQATIDYAQINNLSAEVAFIARGEIEEATINVAQISNLNAQVANIADARISMARINTAQINDLSAQVATIADARIQAATIHTAQIYNLNAQVANIADARINTATIRTAQITNLDVAMETVANAQIEVADIDFAQIKDLNAQSAHFEEAVFEEAIGGKLFVPRLNVVYAQIVSATIGDLVIQATNDNYYKLDVDMDGNVTATQVSLTPEEIEDGHTEDGRTIYLGTDIVADDLNTTNIYASHALMDEIYAGLIDVDQLFAREATITKINAMDLSSNTYIRSTVGEWPQGSTITQTIDSITQRITDLGYANIYYSTTEPSHDNLLVGDIWVKPNENQTWGGAKNNTWGYFHDNFTWIGVYGKYAMYVWTGEIWRLLYDSQVTTELTTEIEQTQAMIALKANRTDLDILDRSVTTRIAELRVESTQIAMTVKTTVENELGQEISRVEGQITVLDGRITSLTEATNRKPTTYYDNTDPGLRTDLHIGDIWYRGYDNITTWNNLKTSWTWGTIRSYNWEDALGGKSYIWNGSQWVITSDRASEVTQKILVTQTNEKYSILARETATLSGIVYENRGELSVLASRITAEVTNRINGQNVAWTKINQTAENLTIEARRAKTAEGELGSQITILAGRITSLTEVTDAKPNVYYGETDPRTSHTVHIGDIWYNTNDSISTWNNVKNNETWGQSKDNLWENSMGCESRVWNGTKWVVTSSLAKEIYHGVLIEQAVDHYTILASESASIKNTVYENRASINVMAGQITSSVSSLQNGQNRLNSLITQTSSEVTIEVNRAINAETTLNSRITTKADEITLAVEQGTTKAGAVQTVGSHIQINTNKIEIGTNGNLYIKDGNNDAITMNKNGITIESGTKVYIKSGGIFDLRSTNLVVKSDSNYLSTLDYDSTKAKYMGIKMAKRNLTFWQGTSDDPDNANNVPINGFCRAESANHVSFWINNPGSGKAASDFKIYQSGILESKKKIETSALLKGGTLNVASGAMTVDSTGTATCLDVTLTSSRTRKHDIRPLEYDEKVIDKLEPVSYVYNVDATGKKRYGLIYEDTIGLMPEICNVVNGEKTISYINLVPVLLKEIQGLRKRVADLEANVA